MITLSRCGKGAPSHDIQFKKNRQILGRIQNGIRVSSWRTLRIQPTRRKKHCHSKKSHDAVPLKFLWDVPKRNKVELMFSIVTIS
jgi:hypothetical protein